MIDGVTYIENFYPNTTQLFNDLLENVTWDASMKARKTASFGVAYNYSQISYPYQKMPSDIQSICTAIQNKIGFEPNNCLINFYENGQSKMGYHSDQTDILESNTGVVIADSKELEGIFKNSSFIILVNSISRRVRRERRGLIINTLRSLRSPRAIIFEKSSNSF